MSLFMTSPLASNLRAGTWAPGLRLGFYTLVFPAVSWQGLGSEPPCIYHFRFVVYVAFSAAPSFLLCVRAAATWESVSSPYPSQVLQAGCRQLSSVRKGSWCAWPVISDSCHLHADCVCHHCAFQLIHKSMSSWVGAYLHRIQHILGRWYELFAQPCHSLTRCVLVSDNFFGVSPFTGKKRAVHWPHPFVFVDNLSTSSSQSLSVAFYSILSQFQEDCIHWLQHWLLHRLTTLHGLDMDCLVSPIKIIGCQL